MGLVNRDRDMLQFAEEFGCITATQAARMFYTGLKSGRREAMKRLNMLVAMGKLKKVQHGVNGEVQYYFKKEQTLHKLKFIDYVTCLFSKGYENISIRKEVEVVVEIKMVYHTYKIDAVVEYKKGDGLNYRDYLEIDFTHDSNKSTTREPNSGEAKERFLLDRHENIGDQLFHDYYAKLINGEETDGFIERLVIVKKYLVHDHSKVVFELIRSDDIMKNAYKFLHEDYKFEAHFLPWDLNTFFFPEQAQIIKETSKVKQAKKVARKIEIKKEIEIAKEIAKKNPVRFTLADVEKYLEDDGLKKDINLLRQEIKELPSIIHL